VTPISEQVAPYTARFLDRMKEEEMAIVRRAYAKHVVANAYVDDARVGAAFAAVRREDFLGPGPWQMLRWNGSYKTTPSDDPVYLYQDALFGIIPERGLNNGQPWLHAMLIAAAAPRSGEHVVHIGAGVGYYTAILAHMVGESGRVTAIEFDGGLAERLAANFAGQPNVRGLQGDGAQIEFDAADAIYVNAGATRPADIWLDRLNDGGPADPAADLGQRFRRKPRKHTDPAARRGIPHRAPQQPIPREMDFSGRDLSVRRRARRRVRAGAGGGVRERRLGAGDTALSARRRARGAVLAKGAGLVPGLRLRSAESAAAPVVTQFDRVIAEPSQIGVLVITFY
jgi:protein-L-isoaspartate O-methyltransferase